MTLLNTYLNRNPSPEELHRYYLTKSVNFARISLSCFFISFIQNVPDIVSDMPLKTWKDYAKILADKTYGNLSISQFFYNLARAALQEAIFLN
ncbi:hypothetical protein [Candidatus Protochlamydia phocaeensis]|uniref:hypothetical protein n=1 Tax=Candidatus Protochlamydia phocaeensis TaxID=1414722 RepID=UPI000838E0F9|nr:hypothetical protein [Candidatus Protochlamydia phocaeensis]